jgi:hypothetical protein
LPRSGLIGLLLALVGISSLSFGLYALLYGGWRQKIGIGPIPERGIHVAAGVKMLLGGALSLAAGACLLWAAL